MTPKQLEKYLKMGEGETLEFKTSFNSDVGMALSAFANTKGGKVFIGVNDKGQVVGVTLNNETVKNWINEIKQKTNPHLIPDAIIVDYLDKNVVVLSVNEIPIKPVAFNGRYYKRIKNSNHPLSLTEISEIYTQTVNSSWDYYIDEDHSLEDISIEKIERLILRLNNREHSITESPIEFLHKLELIRNGKPTKACFLLFLTSKSVLTTIELGFFQSETIIKDSARLQTDILSEMDGVMEFIKKHINKEIIITGELQNNEKWQYPLEALRELVLNMIIHRDYSSSADSIVKVFSNKIVLFNPGLLPTSITIDKLNSNNYNSRPRNKLVANVCKELGWIEKYGTGIRRVRESFELAKLPSPVFEEVSGGFQVTLYSSSPKSSPKSNPKSSPKYDELNTTERAIIDLIASNRNFTKLEMAETLTMSVQNIKKHIGLLTRKGFITYEGSSKRGKWVLLNSAKL